MKKYGAEFIEMRGLPRLLIALLVGLACILEVGCLGRSKQKPAESKRRTTDRRMDSRSPEPGRTSTAKHTAMNKHLDLPYASIPGVPPSLLSLDIYTPSKALQAPVLVMLHGGGWRRGDKCNPNVAGLADTFVSKGYVYVSINYRLSPPARHPDHVQDAAKALAYLHANIGRYGGDPNLLFLMGHSAGAHLASLLATDESRLKANGLDVGIVKGVISLDSGAYDIPRQLEVVRSSANVRKLFENAFGSDPAVLEDASPMHHVKPGHGIPPFLIFYAGNKTASKIIAPEFSAKLSKAGVPVESVSMNKEHEAFLSDLQDPSNPQTKTVMSFLQRRLSALGFSADSPTKAE